MSMKHLIFALVFVMGALGASVRADGSLAEQVEALRQRVEQQDAEIAKLRRASEGGEISDRRMQEMRELVREVLADAEGRTALSESLTGGFDGSRFYLASADGDFLLKVFGLVQFRHVLSTADDAFDARDGDSGTVGVQPTDLDDTRQGFEMRRARFYFKGHVVDPSWQYFLHFQVSRSDGDAVLLDAWVKKQLNDEWAVMAGQIKVPVWREWIISGERQPFVERSLLHSEFSGAVYPGYPGCVEAGQRAGHPSDRRGPEHAQYGVERGGRGGFIGQRAWRLSD